MLRSLRWIMAASPEVIQRLEQRSALADQMINKLNDQLQGLKQAAGPEKALADENARLLAEVEELKRKLNILEARNGLMQFSGPVKDGPKPNGTTPTADQTKASEKTEKRPATGDGQKTDGKKDKKAKTEKKEKGGGKQAPQAAPAVIDVSLLDLRIGKIVAVELHPDADTLYVEQIDCGEGTPRTILSGLVEHVPIDQMQDRLVVVLCNLKPRKMRGILSQGMVMCACGPDKTEILSPPSGAVPGDRVSCEGYPLSDGFPPEMNPKKKIFETVQPELSTNSDRVATYKGAPWKVEGKGCILAPTISNTQIK